MARRRMISAEMIADRAFNSISLIAQNTFIRMLAVSDDCGVVPAESYRLNTIINTPPSARGKIQTVIDEIAAAGLGARFDHREEPFFVFKTESFENFQSYILKKATKSEYLNISREEFLGISKKFWKENKSALSTVESKEVQVKSKEQRQDPQTLSPREKAWAEFAQHRREIGKKLTPLAEAKARKRLTILSGGNDLLAVKIIEQTISNGWSGLFELRENFSRSGARESFKPAPRKSLCEFGCGALLTDQQAVAHPDHCQNFKTATPETMKAVGESLRILHTSMAANNLIPPQTEKSKR